MLYTKRSWNCPSLLLPSKKKIAKPEIKSTWQVKQMLSGGEQTLILILVLICLNFNYDNDEEDDNDHIDDDEPIWCSDLKLSTQLVFWDALPPSIWPFCFLSRHPAMMAKPAAVRS